MRTDFVREVSERNYGSDEAIYLDRRRFVQNLGCLLAQTREGIESADLDRSDIVTIFYTSGHQRKINVAMDSYLAIIKDVARHL